MLRGSSPTTLLPAFPWRLCGLILVPFLCSFVHGSVRLIRFRADYMFQRQVFTLDPDYFPLERMREIVEYLHDHDQQYSRFLE